MKLLQFFKKQPVYNELEKNIIDILELVSSLEIEKINEITKYGRKQYCINIMFKNKNNLIMKNYNKDTEPTRFVYENKTIYKKVTLDDSFIKKNPKLLKIILKYLPRLYERGHNFLRIQHMQEYEKEFSDITRELKNLLKNDN